jgi:hypothetical protein
MPPRSTYRRQHIQSILRVFRRRGVDWPEFGEFLLWLFGPGGRFELRTSDCRHAPGGIHHEHLSDIQVLPCVTTGVPDHPKAPKLVVSDLRSRAREFLHSIGYGTILPWGDVVGPALVMSDSEEEELEGELEGENPPVTGDGSWGELSFGHLAGELHSDPYLPSSDPVPGASRRSTGIRAYVLTYLVRFARDPIRLEEEVRRLFDDTLVVCHLCGCGSRRLGCVEPTHLTLGQQSENIEHAHYHHVLAQSTEVQYLPLVRIIRTMSNGEGLL